MKCGKKTIRWMNKNTAQPTGQNVGKENKEMTADNENRKVRYIHERCKDIAVFADAIKTLQNGETVQGYKSVKELTEEIAILTKDIIDVCARI